MNPILECVPNISEGRDINIISQLAKIIETQKDVKLLDTDIGYSANRTVFTFAGSPRQVKIASYELIKKAIELIDMTKHTGVHPRIGAVDVCPFIPVKGINMNDAVKLARELARQTALDFDVPVYCYGKAAFKPSRANLSQLRAGQYEKLGSRLQTETWKPDFGPAKFVPKTGAINIGARKFLVAFNINLDSPSLEPARDIAGNIRESGKWITDNSGKKKKIRGKLKAVQAIAWKINEFNKIQVSTNITDIDSVPLYLVFEEVKKMAAEKGTRVTGSEIVGMVPYQYFIETATYYAGNSGKTIHDHIQLIKLAVDKLGLNDVRPFIPEKKIFEWVYDKK